MFFFQRYTKNHFRCINIVECQFERPGPHHLYTHFTQVGIPHTSVSVNGTYLFTQNI